MKSLRRLWRLLNYTWTHPGNAKARGRALWRVLRWQLAVRLWPAGLIFPWVGDARLILRRGRPGANLNVYGGLHEWDSMWLLLHLLRPGDDFIDGGANLGSFSILAAKQCGARVLAFEPNEASRAALQEHLELNAITDRVKVCPQALAAEAGHLSFRQDMDCRNHVLQEGGAEQTVSACTLDEWKGQYQPRLLKLDLEGYEWPALQGGEQLLADPSLWVLIVEFSAASERYGYHSADIDRHLQQLGFQAMSYAPQERRLAPLATLPAEGNVFYVRELASVEARLQDAPSPLLFPTESRDRT